MKQEHYEECQDDYQAMDRLEFLDIHLKKKEKRLE
jgi:hypothetical protein